MKATYRDHGGTDLSVVNAARVSFNSTSLWETVHHEWSDLTDEAFDQLIKEGWEEVTDIEAPGNNGEYVILKRLKQKDINLIQYLARGMPRKEWEGVIKEIMNLGVGEDAFNVAQWKIEDLMLMAQHWVPFTHTMVTLHMVAPVPIARQLFKHKMGFTESEESRRYVSDAVSLYIPTEFRAKADNVKQGSGGTHPNSYEWLKVYKQVCYEAIRTYDRMIETGIAPEQARFVLPQGVEVQWIWTGNLASFARFYNQRSDTHAQLESQQLAKQVGDIIRPLFPVSWDALVKSGRTE